MTEHGFSPDLRQRRTRSSVHSSGFGRLPDSNSTCAAGLKVISWRAIAAFRAVRRVRRMAWRVAGPFVLRYGFISPSFARSSASRLRSAILGAPALPGRQRVSCSRRAAFSASITSLSSAIASNISAR
ncbi:hypothetical protein ABZ672_16135 [Streptomyces mirabilis]|uniref:hypothetical protein n=1 Tax=Streptomyces mirabilis TaxID=68239 RepID=UPI00340FD93E